MDHSSLEAACNATEPVVAGLSTTDLKRPSPCERWTVRDLVNHLVGTLELSRALLSDTPPTVAVGPGQLPPTDLIGDDPLDAYRNGVEAMLRAATPQTTAAMHVTPLGDMPGPMLAGFTTLDIYVHGWDLAKATDQKPPADDRLAEEILGFARQAISDESGTRAPRIGPEIEVLADASVMDRLVGFLGRTP
jgi:uncharacterized protein (TIGR03086 family)